MRSRHYPISKTYFETQIAPLICSQHKVSGHPVKIRHYDFFCAVLFVLRTGVPWRDLPEHYGAWHTIYTRFKRWCEKGLFWNLLSALQKRQQITVDISWIDSTTIALHRHGGGALKKRALSQQVEAERD